MSFVPAGYSDSENSDDDFFEEPRPRAIPVKQKPTNLIEAIREKDADLTLHFITQPGANLDYHYSSREKPLITACGETWPLGVSMLLKNGADPNVERELMTPLLMCCACSVGKEDEIVECVKLLLDHEADPNVVDKRGRVALHYAAEGNLRQVVQCLLESHKTNKNAADPAGWTALFFAKQKGHMELVEDLIKAGLDPNTMARKSLRLNDIIPSKLEEEKSELSVLDIFSESRSYYIEEEITKESSDKLKLQKFLNDLPDSAGEGGFCETVPKYLNIIGCRDLTLESAHMPDLLSGNMDNLANLGAKFSWFQRRIAKGAHKFHLYEWGKKSLNVVPVIEPLGLDAIGELLGNQLYQLVMMKSGLIYVERRLADVDSEEIDVNILTVMQDLVQLRKAQARLRRRLGEVLLKLNQLRDIHDYPIDYVGPPSKEKKSAKTQWFFIPPILFLVGAVFYCWSS